VFAYAVVIVKACLSTPANMESAVDVAFAPLHYLTKFIPVVDFFEVHKFHRRAGYYHAIVIIIADLVKGLVEGYHMFF
jgi:hypothetical protein